MELESSLRDTNTFVNVVHNAVYNKDWEEEIIMRIARKLAQLPVDINLMFGLFTQGQRNCTKSDFKHVVLHRLNLGKTGMEERELDLIF